MANTKTDLMKALKTYSDFTEVTIKIGDTEFPIQIKTALDPAEQVAFVESVSDSMIVDGKRYYALYNFSFGYSLIHFYTNLTMPKTQKDITTLIYKTSIIDEIAKTATWEQIDALESACQDYIQAQQATEIAYLQATQRPDPLNRIADSIENFFNAVKGAVTPENMQLLCNMMENRDDGFLEKVLDKIKAGEEIGKKNSTEPANVSGIDGADQPGESPT